MTRTHPIPAELFSFISGRADADRHAEIEAHLQECQDCVALLALLPETPLARLARESARPTVTDHTPFPELRGNRSP